MAYLANIPLSTDLQSVSQGQILGNFTQLNTSFGIDHYPFTTNGSNTGFHNQVTTPARVGGAPAIGATPIFYAIQPSANIGLVQYSLGTTLSGPATPLTSRQAASGGQSVNANTTITILDFTGVTEAMAMLYCATGANYSVSMVNLYGGTLYSRLVSGSSLIVVSQTGLALTVQNNTSGAVTLHWTLQFVRII